MEGAVEAGVPLAHAHRAPRHWEAQCRELAMSKLDSGAGEQTGVRRLRTLHVEAKKDQQGLVAGVREYAGFGHQGSWVTVRGQVLREGERRQGQ